MSGWFWKCLNKVWETSFLSIPSLSGSRCLILPFPSVMQLCMDCCDVSLHNTGSHSSSGQMLHKDILFVQDEESCDAVLFSFPVRVKLAFQFCYGSENREPATCGQQKYHLTINAAVSVYVRCVFVSTLFQQSGLSVVQASIISILASLHLHFLRQFANILTDTHRNLPKDSTFNRIFHTIIFLYS